ncbi:hypothetical protein CRUP_001543 [Coryphaenoides rupestris]|nr:hypothetical protein CRUP_001543 [Coryphaenoides rupestris]
MTACISVAAGRLVKVGARAGGGVVEGLMFTTVLVKSLLHHRQQQQQKQPSILPAKDEAIGEKIEALLGVLIDWYGPRSDVGVVVGVGVIVAFGGAIDGANLCMGAVVVAALSPPGDLAAGRVVSSCGRRPVQSFWAEGEEEEEERGSGEAGVSGVPALVGFWSTCWLLSFTGPRAALGTATATWDPGALSTALSGAGGWGAGLGGEEVPQSVAAAAAAAAAAMEQGVRVASLPSHALGVVAPPPLPPMMGLEGGVEGVRSSSRGSDITAFALGLFHSPGGEGLRNSSLATEMNALPGVEKGRGSGADLRSYSSPSRGLADRRASAWGAAQWGGAARGENVGVRGSEEGRETRQREGSVPPGPRAHGGGPHAGGGGGVKGGRPTTVAARPGCPLSPVLISSSRGVHNRKLAALLARGPAGMADSLSLPACCWPSEWEISRLCFRPPAPTPADIPPATGEEQEGGEEEEESEEASFSADCTRLSSGERGGSALLGREIWRASGGEECSLTGKPWPPGVWPPGEGERCGELPCGVGEGVRASGDSGMLPADLRRGDRYCRWSLGARPCRELGRMWPELADPRGSPEWAESGVVRWPWVGLRGDRLCVGDPGPLSPDDSERVRDDRLRLVCSRDACLAATAGDMSRLGDESREDGLDDREWGDIGLAKGEAPWVV